MSQIYDPDKIGPTDRCLRCWVRYGNRVNYCENCGKIGPISHYSDFDHKYYCVNHPTTPTQEFCGLCANPVCTQCQERRTDPLSAPAPIPWCFTCVRTTAATEQRFLENLAASGMCAKHSNEHARFHCKSCALPLCPACAYYHVVGFFRRRHGDGPYCLTCFRSSRVTTGQRGWLSGTTLGLS
jgi:B-box zinc finger